MTTDHRYKYIKYKKKYLNLRGGLEDLKTITSIIITHNGRLRCMLDKLFPGTIDDLLKKYNSAHPDKKPVDEIRFKNGCILKCKLKYDIKCTISLQMVYSGTVTKRKEGLYFKSPNDSANKLTVDTNATEDTDTDTDIVFPEIKRQMNPAFCFGKTTLTEIDHEIYIIRHGEASHNVSSVNFKKDTILTNQGIIDTKRTGEELSLLLNLTKNDKIYYFASDLKRTRQTLSIINEQLKKNPKLNLPKEIIVAPCSKELSYTHTGDCDAKNYKFIPFENRHVCSSSQTQCVSNCLDVNTNDLCCCAKGGLKINWDYYNEFHNKKLHCRFTSLVQEIIKIIHQ